MKTRQDILGVIMKGINKDFDFERFQPNIIEGQQIDLRDSVSSKDILISKIIASKLQLKVGDTPIIYFLNAPDVKFISHSEEHLVVEAQLGHTYKAGDILFGLPVHICPTCALYERAQIVQNNIVTGEWKMIARDRKINV